MYKISIDKNKCIGCGNCVNDCPKFFERKNGKAVVKVSKTEDECVKKAAAECPTKAIKVIKV